MTNYTHVESFVPDGKWAETIKKVREIEANMKLREDPNSRIIGEDIHEIVIDIWQIGLTSSRHRQFG